MNKPNILLDLDQTIISAHADEEYDFKTHKEKAKKFKYSDMDGYYIVFQRPGLQKFLDFLFKHFNVSIWTAASKDYALYIVEHIILAKKGRNIDWIFFSYHCDISKHFKKGTKDLSMLWDIYKIPGYDNTNTYIIDDYDEVYKTQPNNCIIALPFEFMDKHSESDDFLHKLSQELPKLKEYKPKNVKHINKSLNK